MTGVSSINGVVFGSDGKIGGVSLSGGKVDGVDVGWLDQRVKSLEDNGTGGGGTGGGGSSANTSGIHKPDGDTTNIEGNTSITTDGIDTNKVNASDSIVVADGEKNKTVISKDGILRPRAKRIRSRSMKMVSTLVKTARSSTTPTALLRIKDCISASAAAAIPAQPNSALP